MYFCFLRQEMEVDDTSDVISKEVLLEQCDKKGYLDGKYFVPCMERTESAESIIAKCLLCEINDNTVKYIKGSLQVSSNFRTHI